jgi:SAM-dependent methyltransferase
MGQGTCYLAETMASKITRHLYIAANLPAEVEGKRLSALEEMGDPRTRQRLEQLGIRPGWRCLEVGAGRGSVARWMAERVEPSGHVVAADIDPRFLTAIDTPGLEVRQHDVLERDFEPGHYDVVHCRALLMHLSSPDLAIRRMAAAVRPGGWLLMEEADFGAWGAVDPDYPGATAFDRATRAVWDTLHRLEVMDVRFGRRLSTLVEQLGWQEADHDARLRVSHGADPVGRFWAVTLSSMRSSPLLDAAAITPGELATTLELLDDRSFAFLGPIPFCAWAKRPS